MEITCSSINGPIVFCLKSFKMIDCAQLAYFSSGVRKSLGMLLFGELYTFPYCAVGTFRC